MASKPTWKIAVLAGRVCAKYHPDGKVFFASNPTTNSWKAVTVGQNPTSIDAHEDAVNGIAVSHDGKRIVTYSADGTVLAWNWPDHKDKGDLLTRFDSPVLCTDFSACDNLLACGAQDGTVKIINVTDSNQIRKIKAHEGQIKGIAFDPTRQYLATAGADGVIKIFDYINGDTQVASLTAATPAMLSDRVSFEMDWHPSGSFLAVPGLSGISLVTKPEGAFKEWKIGSKLDEYKQESFVAKWSPNGRYLASSHADSHFLIWDVTTKLSIDRVKCPELALALQWNRAANALLVCLSNGRYAEMSGIIPKSLPDPIKAYDAASLAAQEYESQRQSLDNMFAAEEATPKAPEPKQSSSGAPALRPTLSAPSGASLNIPKGLSTAAKKTTSDDANESMEVDFYSKPHFGDTTSDYGGSHSRTRGLDDYGYEYADDSGYGGASSASGRLFEMQAPFMPSATQGGGSRRIMAWNHLGSIVARVEEYPTLQTSMEMDFSDVSRFKPFSLSLPFAVDLATLGEQGVFTASRQVRSGANKKVVTNLQFNMFNKLGANADWTVMLGHGECAVGLAIGDTWSAVATSQRRLRLFGDAGSRLAVLSLPGAPISICGHGPLLGVLFHAGLPTQNTNGVPKSFSEAVAETGMGSDSTRSRRNYDGDDGYDDGNNSTSETHTQTVGWWVFHVGQRRLLSSGSPLPLSPGGSVAWFGFSIDGSLCTFDTKGILRQLAATRRYTFSSTPLVLSDAAQLMGSLEPAWSDIWFEVLDTSEHATSKEVVWPIAVTNEKLRYVKHSRNLDGPTANPKPVPQYVALAMPFEPTSVGSGASEQNPLSHENAWIRAVVGLNATIGDILTEKMSVDQSLGEKKEIDESDDSSTQGIPLIDLASDKQVLTAQAKLDGLVLKLVREACQEGRVERAFGLAKTLVLKKSLQVAAQVASRASHPQLADMIAEWAERREVARKRVNDASQKMVSPPAPVISNGFSSLGTHSMSLPQGFDNDWSSDTATRKTAGVKRNTPDLPSSSAKTSGAKKVATQPANVNNGSDDEFEVDDEEDEVEAPANKKFTTQAIEDDEDGIADPEEDKLGEDVNSENDMDIDDTRTRGKDTSVFKSSPFAIAPPFQQGSGKLADTLSSIGKSKKSAAPAKLSSKPKSSLK
jgi:chromosome transmission fidelity protein 4